MTRTHEHAVLCDSLCGMGREFRKGLESIIGYDPGPCTTDDAAAVIDELHARLEAQAEALRAVVAREQQALAVAQQAAAVLGFTLTCAELARLADKEED